MKANVFVTLKPGVLDPQGRAVHKTLSGLGFAGVADVRIGKLVEITLTVDDSASPEAARAQAEAEVHAMCQKLLANPVIEDFRVEIVE